ncbi:MAG: 4Fe-4S binding protein [Planctomycetota bacterium]|jgi:ferredoxin
MNRLPRISIVLLLWLLCTVTALSIQRFPPPEFEETDHTIPTATQPSARSVGLEILDVAVLVAVLSLASWLVLKKRSRRWIVVLMLFSLAYFGFWRKGCICSIGAIGNITLAIFDTSYAIPWVVLAFFFLPLVFTLFFGRSFCAAVCPLGAVQDIVLLRPLNIPPWLETTLRLLAWLYLTVAILLAATGSAFIICRYDPFVAFFRFSANPAIWVISFSMLIIAIFVGRPYCRFLCPYGLILRQLVRISKFRVTITPDECIHCRLCEGACPFGAIEKPTVEWPRTEYPRGRRRLITLICLLPVFIAAGLWIGHRLHPKLAQSDPVVQLAQRVQLEQAGVHLETIDMSKAFYSSGRTLEDLYHSAEVKQSQVAIGSALMGGLMGLIIGGTLLMHSIFWKRAGYEAHRAGCVACGRCYNYCPRHRKWLKDKKT